MNTIRPMIFFAGLLMLACGFDPNTDDGDLHNTNSDLEDDNETTSDDELDSSSDMTGSSDLDTDQATDAETDVVDDDECDSTSECQTLYGADATDCVDRTSDTSWCECGNIPCSEIDNAGAVEITVPADNAIFDANDDVTVKVNASGSGGVQFFVNDYAVNTDNSAPYQNVIKYLQGGTYTIKAVQGADEDIVTITVNPFRAKNQYNFIRLNNNKPIIDKQKFIDAGATRNIRDSDEYEWDNINGPSVLRIPSWIPDSKKADPTAIYYMYFGHHHGQCIRLAWAAKITGPWTLYNMGVGVAVDEKGVLAFDNNGSIKRDDQIKEIGNGLALRDHMASPEIFVDDGNQQIIMYFHSPYSYNGKDYGQVTFAAASSFGLDFNDNMASVIQTRAYFTVWEYKNEYYGFTTGASLYHHPDPENFLEPVGSFDYREGEYWEKGSQVLRSDVLGTVRHVKALVKDNVVYAAYSNMYDVPEQLYYRTIDLTQTDDWSSWKASPTIKLATAETGWEGGQFPVEASKAGASDKGVNQLRDPYIFEDDDGMMYVFYTGQGEDAIGIARLVWQ